MVRFTMFIIALLLAIGAIGPSAPWLVTLAVLSGVEAVRFRRWFADWPAALAVAVFVISLLLAVEAVEATGAWLVTLAVLTGLEAFRPRRSGRDWFGRRRRRWRMRRAWAGPDWDEDGW